mmetsp:Transcript_22418/g.50880  ORF Transcript_22418/g.50880 Transcript_22418/m.50880 type:complete len:91 (+) Transcript_22418:739-1011(+)
MCGEICSTLSDCAWGEWCWSVHPNYCGSLPTKNFIGTPSLGASPRCGTSELDARGLCKNKCISSLDCDTAAGEMCLGVNWNYCDSPFVEE